jgi:beta-lactamase class A
MKLPSLPSKALFLVLFLFVLVSMRAAEPLSESALQSVVSRSLDKAVTDFSSQQLKRDEVAITLIDLTDAARPATASFRGAERIYPASVVKMLYLAAAHRWMEDKKLADTPELRRAMKDMIVESYNEATHYVVDVLTGTTSGPELPEAELAEWFKKRNVVTDYFRSLGYTNVIAHKKPWCEGPYGRESQAIRVFEPKRNFLSTDDTARLLAEIALGKCVTPKRSAEMMELMKRDPFATGGDLEDQARGFTGQALKPGDKLWSKAGWTSQTRHDAAYVELPNGRKFVLVVFTENHANERKILATIAGEVREAFAR